MKKKMHSSSKQNWRKQRNFDRKMDKFEKSLNQGRSDDYQYRGGSGSYGNHSSNQQEYMRSDDYQYRRSSGSYSNPTSSQHDYRRSDDYQYHGSSGSYGHSATNQAGYRRSDDYDYGGPSGSYDNASSSQPEYGYGEYSAQEEHTSQLTGRVGGKKPKKEKPPPHLKGKEIEQRKELGPTWVEDDLDPSAGRGEPARPDKRGACGPLGEGSTGHYGLGPRPALDQGSYTDDYTRPSVSRQYDQSLNQRCNYGTGTMTPRQSQLELDHRSNVDCRRSSDIHGDYDSESSMRKYPQTNIEMVTDHRSGVYDCDSARDRECDNRLKDVDCYPRPGKMREFDRKDNCPSYSERECDPSGMDNISHFEDQREYGSGQRSVDVYSRRGDYDSRFKIMDNFPHREEGCGDSNPTHDNLPSGSKGNLYMPNKRTHDPGLSDNDYFEEPKRLCNVDHRPSVDYQCYREDIKRESSTSKCPPMNVHAKVDFRSNVSDRGAGDGRLIDSKSRPGDYSPQQENERQYDSKSGRTDYYPQKGNERTNESRSRPAESWSRHTDYSPQRENDRVYDSRSRHTDYSPQRENDREYDSRSRPPDYYALPETERMNDSRSRYMDNYPHRGNKWMNESRLKPTDNYSQENEWCDSRSGRTDYSPQQENEMVSDSWPRSKDTYSQDKSSNQDSKFGNYSGQDDEKLNASWTRNKAIYAQGTNVEDYESKSKDRFEWLNDVLLSPGKSDEHESQAQIEAKANLSKAYDSLCKGNPSVKSASSYPRTVKSKSKPLVDNAKQKTTCSSASDKLMNPKGRHRGGKGQAAKLKSLQNERDILYDLFCAKLSSMTLNEDSKKSSSGRKNPFNPEALTFQKTTSLSNSSSAQSLWKTESYQLTLKLMVLVRGRLCLKFNSESTTLIDKHIGSLVQKNRAITRAGEMTSEDSYKCSGSKLPKLNRNSQVPSVEESSDLMTSSGAYGFLKTGFLNAPASKEVISDSFANSNTGHKPVNAFNITEVGTDSYKANETKCKKPKPFKAFIKGIPIETKPSIIRKELISLGFDVRNVFFLRRSKKQKLQGIPEPNCFMVQLEVGEKNKDLFNVKTLLGSDIVVEECKPPQLEQKSQSVVYDGWSCYRDNNMDNYPQCNTRFVHFNGSDRSSILTNQSCTNVTDESAGSKSENNNRSSNADLKLENREVNSSCDGYLFKSILETCQIFLNSDNKPQLESHLNPDSNKALDDYISKAKESWCRSDLLDPQVTSTTDCRQPGLGNIMNYSIKTRELWCKRDSLNSKYISENLKTSSSKDTDTSAKPNESLSNSGPKHQVFSQPPKSTPGSISDTSVKSNEPLSKSDHEKPQVFSQPSKSTIPESIPDTSIKPKEPLSKSDHAKPQVFSQPSKSTIPESIPDTSIKPKEPLSKSDPSKTPVISQLSKYTIPRKNVPSDSQIISQPSKPSIPRSIPDTSVKLNESRRISDPSKTQVSPQLSKFTIPRKNVPTNSQALSENPKPFIPRDVNSSVQTKDSWRGQEVLGSGPSNTGVVSGYMRSPPKNWRSQVPSRSGPSFIPDEPWSKNGSSRAAVDSEYSRNPLPYSRSNLPSNTGTSGRHHEHVGQNTASTSKFISQSLNPPTQRSIANTPSYDAGPMTAKATKPARFGKMKREPRSKPFKAMLRGLPRTVKVGDIKNALTDLGFVVRDVFLMRRTKKQKKQGVGLIECFLIHLEVDSNNEELYKVKELLGYNAEVLEYIPYSDNYLH